MNTHPHKKANRVALTAIAALLAVLSVNAYSGPFSVEVVKLYSEGKVVGQWEATEKGHMEGQCYVFKIKKRANTPEVRVCGTFSVEGKR